MILSEEFRALNINAVLAYLPLAKCREGGPLAVEGLCIKNTINL